VGGRVVVQLGQFPLNPDVTLLISQFGPNTVFVYASVFPLIGSFSLTSSPPPLLIGIALMGIVASFVIEAGIAYEAV